MPEHSIDPQVRALVQERLGREPRGLRAVAVIDGAGMPMVIRVASLVDARPFPTLYWLIDPDLCLRIDRDEARGVIGELQEAVDADSELRKAMAEDHARHIHQRDTYLSAEERAALEGRGFMAALSERGIGGIADFTRIRCLHTWYAAHLVTPNTIGRLLEARWRAETAPGT